MTFRKFDHLGIFVEYSRLFEAPPDSRPQTPHCADGFVRGFKQPRRFAATSTDRLTPHTQNHALRYMQSPKQPRRSTAPYVHKRVQEAAPWSSPTCGKPGSP